MESGSIAGGPRQPARRPARTRTAVRFAAALLALAVLSAAVACGGAAPSPAASLSGLRVVASFFPMYDFARKIAGGRAVASLLVPAGSEPHSWEPSAGDIAALERADVFIYSGAGMEQWAPDVLASLSNTRLSVVEASAGLTLLAGGGEHEGETDPHVWLSPANAKRQMAAIRDALALADPDGADTYRSNYDTYSAELDVLDAEYRAALAPFAGRAIVVAHEAFGYLCDAYGLVQIPVEGLSPDSEPDPARVAEVIRLVREHDVHVIFFEETASSKVADMIAEEAGIQVDVLNPVASLDAARISEGEDYFTVMYANLQALVLALSDVT